MIVYSIVNDNSDKRLGQYDPKTGIITIYVRTIQGHCRKRNESYHDLKELVIRHEQAHKLQHRYGVQLRHRFGKKKMPMLQVEANGYAMRSFVRDFGRLPQAYIGQWR